MQYTITMKVQTNHSLFDYLWIKPSNSEARYFWEPESIEELNEFEYLYERIITIGAGSNLIIGKFDGLVIHTAKLNQIFFKDNLVIAEAGILNKILVIKSIREGVGGFEFLFTIPGTVGGSTFMNAGAHGHSISEVIEWVEIIDYAGKLHRLSKEELNFSYRSSSIPLDCIISRVAIRTEEIKKNKSKETIKEIEDYVNRFQPRSLTAGCVFKNPPGDSAWKLISELEPEDLRSKNCHFSELHRNFLINDGNASAEELRDLAFLVQAKIYEKNGVMLEFEFKFIVD